MRGNAEGSRNIWWKTYVLDIFFLLLFPCAIAYHHLGRQVGDPLVYPR